MSTLSPHNHQDGPSGAIGRRTSGHIRAVLSAPSESRPDD
jgi:hypothetical protein